MTKRKRRQSPRSYLAEDIEKRVTAKVNEITGMFYKERAALQDALKELSEKIEIVNRDYRLAFVWGTATIGESDQETTMGSLPVSILRGDVEEIELRCQSKLRNVTLHVEPPFLIREVKIGNQSQLWAVEGAVTRTVKCGTMDPAHRVIVSVYYPSGAT